jgi:hypothetical protein
MFTSAVSHVQSFPLLAIRRTRTLVGALHATISHQSPQISPQYPPKCAKSLQTQRDPHPFQAVAALVIQRCSSTEINQPCATNPARSITWDTCERAGATFTGRRALVGASPNAPPPP